MNIEEKLKIFENSCKKLLEIDSKNLNVRINQLSTHYSTEEQVVGTWMGEPLYQKTILYDLTNKVSSAYYDAIIDNTITESNSCVVSATGGVYIGDSYKQFNIFPQTSGGTNNRSYAIDVIPTGVRFTLYESNPSVYSNYSSVVATIQYTKTTDSANAALTTPGAYNINFPNTWPENKEIFFGNGVYGQRFTGNTPALSTDSSDKIILKPSGTFTDSFKMVNSGGSMTILNSSNEKVNINLNASHNTSSSVLRASSNIYKTGTGALNLGIYMGDWHTTTSSTYDVWVTYTK